MPNGRKRLFAAVACSILMAASMAAAPAPAQTGGDDDAARVGEPCNPIVGGSYNGLECCYYPGQGWYYYYNVIGGGYCSGGGYYQPPEESGDRPADEPTEPAGQ